MASLGKTGSRKTHEENSDLRLQCIIALNSTLLEQDQRRKARLNEITLGMSRIIRTDEIVVEKKR